MVEGPSRVDGWKAIAAHFKRDRSTVIRWANEEGLPIRRMPGGKGVSVWAYVHELDAWRERDLAQPTVRASPRGSRRSLYLSLGAGLVLLAGAGLILGFRAFQTTAPPPPAARLPADPATADLYLRARDDWSQRTPASLTKALDEFAQVTGRDPGFAPAYAGMADVYIEERDFAALPNDIAFPRIEAAAKAALAIDPDSVEANRALGFVDFWRRHDLGAARARFARVFKAAPNDAQAHLWLGNILSDVGDDAGALRELGAARDLNPGSQAIAADYALEVWLHNPNAASVAALERLATQDAPSATHTYLSWAYLVRGDLAGYLAQQEKVAALEGSPAETAHVAALRQAFQAGGASAMLNRLAGGPAPGAADFEIQPEWPATAAALLGDRGRLLTWLARGKAVGDRWSTWQSGQPRFEPWRGDREVMSGLEAVGARPAGAR